MKMMLTVAGLLAVLALVAAGAFLAAGPDRVWRLVAGDPDLGQVNFAALDRPHSGNSFLLCPADRCGPARPDLVSPVYGVPPAALAGDVAAAMEALPRTQRVDDGSDPLRARFVVRSRLMGFPDTVSVEAFPAGDGSDASTLAVFSRSQLGRSDLGVNAARVRGLLRTLAARLPVDRPDATPGG